MMGASALQTALAVLWTRATLRCLGLSALIACASCGPPPGKPIDGQTSNVLVYTDEATGCVYLIYSRNTGHAGMGGITPRLDSDGKPLCGDKLAKALADVDRELAR